MVLGGSTLVGGGLVVATQMYARTPWMRWWGDEDEMAELRGEAPPKRAPEGSAHATLMKRKAGQADAAESEGDQRASQGRHQLDVMSESQRERADELSRLLLGTNDPAEVAAKLDAIRAKAEKQAREGGGGDSAPRLKHILDIIVYCLVFILILYGLSVEYNFSLSRAARSMLPLESDVLEDMWHRWQLLRVMWREALSAGKHALGM